MDPAKTAVGPVRAAALEEDAALQALASSVNCIKGVGPRLSAALAQLRITTVEDLLYLLPRAYLDKRRIHRIAELCPGEHATVIGTICSVAARPLAGRRKMLRICIADGSGTLDLAWFHLSAAYCRLLSTRFVRGLTVTASGHVARFRLANEMHHPEIDLLEESDQGKRLCIDPLYPLTEGIHQKTMKKMIRGALHLASPYLIDHLPPDILQQYNLPDLRTALHQVHAPENGCDILQMNQWSSCYHRRIVFDELFFVQLGLAIRKAGVASTPGIAMRAPVDLRQRLRQQVPFALTSDQQRCLDDILADMSMPRPMHRLIQGDVGCGKTILALLACCVAAWNGYQAAIMAPTEILAEQHYKTACDFCLRSGISPVLLTGSQPKAQRQLAQDALQQGAAQLVIGTHSLIQEGVRFCKLGLVVVDEQHKFGVLQRAEILKKGAQPDLLVMTATPIPRTLGLTLYGDLDISTIRELPPGRPKVRTLVFQENQRASVYRLVAQELRHGNQAFIVYPLVNESENRALMDATRMAAHLQQDVFADHRVGLLHGQLPPAEKEAIMASFQAGRIHILVATTVIEVGLHVPNASVMVIEHAERFGLAQLHQLRGRIGRGTSESLCLLLAQQAASDDAQQRLIVMARTTNGFEIAEEDFRLRGPGEFLGTRQSGLPDFRVAHMVRDAAVLAEARSAAFALAALDPQLRLPEHRYLGKLLRLRLRGRHELAGIG